jgi:CheY-like chemotaxis protein
MMELGKSPKKTILIADDDLISMTMLKSVISKAGYSVLTAENGTEALDIARTQTPDVIILDVMMPNMDGAEVAATLKKNPMTQAIPIILLSSLISTQEERNKVKKGFVSYLSKPFDREKLLNEIRRHLVKKDDTQ